jgi:hypothetical protein
VCIVEEKAKMMKRKILVGMVVFVCMSVLIMPVIAEVDFPSTPSGFGDKGVKAWEKRADEYLERQYLKIHRANELGIKILEVIFTAKGYTTAGVESFNMVLEGYRRIPTSEAVADAMGHVEPGAKIVVIKSLENPQDVEYYYVYPFGTTPLFEQGRRALRASDIVPRPLMVDPDFYLRQHFKEIQEGKEPYCSEYDKLVKEDEEWIKNAEHLKSDLSNFSTQTSEPPVIKIDEDKIKRILDEQNNLIPPPKLPIEEPSETLGGINFTAIQLNYISTFSDRGFGVFNFALKAKKAEQGDEIINIEEASELSLISFCIGLTLPESEFWVNLNPWEPDRIIEKDLEETDIGRIMLEADLQMKKDFSKYDNPCKSVIGEEYRELLEEKGE